jgi:hypothetical protein
MSNSSLKPMLFVAPSGATGEESLLRRSLLVSVNTNPASLDWVLANDPRLKDFKSIGRWIGPGVGLGISDSPITVLGLSLVLRTSAD